MSDPMENTPPPMTSGISEDERMWAMFAHLSALLGGLLTSAFGGWGSFLGPLVIWRLAKSRLALAALWREPQSRAMLLIAGAPLALISSINIAICCAEGEASELKLSSTDPTTVKPYRCAK